MRAPWHPTCSRTRLHSHRSYACEAVAASLTRLAAYPRVPKTQRQRKLKPKYGENTRAYLAANKRPLSIGKPLPPVAQDTRPRPMGNAIGGFVSSLMRRNTLTSTGKAFLLAAANPAHAGSLVDPRFPDGTRFPTMSVHVRDQMTITCPAADAENGTYSVDMNLLPDLVCPVACRTAYAATNYEDKILLNSFLHGEDYFEKSNSLYDGFSKWRVIGQSVTLDFEGEPAKKTGLIYAAQLPYAPTLYNPGYATETGIGCAIHMQAFQTEAFPDVDGIAPVPDMYRATVDEGLYMVLMGGKYEWAGTNTVRLNAQFASDAVGDTLSPIVSIAGDTTHRNHDPPYYANGEGQVAAAECVINGGAITQVNGVLVPAPSGPHYGRILLRGLNPSVSITVTSHLVLELMPAPKSAYTALARPPPMKDNAAIDLTDVVVAALPHGYPASYNDMNAVWNWISRIAKAAAPIIGVIPGIGGPLAGAITAAATAGDAIQAAIQRRSNRPAPKA